MTKVYQNRLWADTAIFRMSFQRDSDGTKHGFLRVYDDPAGAMEVSPPLIKSRWDIGEIIGTKTLMDWSLWISEWLDIPRDEINPAFIDDCPGTPEGMWETTPNDPRAIYEDICGKHYRSLEGIEPLPDGSLLYFVPASTEWELGSEQAIEIFLESTSLRDISGVVRLEVNNLTQSYGWGFNGGKQITSVKGIYSVPSDWLPGLYDVTVHWGGNHIVTYPNAIMVVPPPIGETKVYQDRIWADTALWKWSFNTLGDGTRQAWLREWIDGVNWGPAFQVSAALAKSRWDRGEIVGTKTLMDWSLWISEWLDIPRDEINPAFIDDCPSSPDGLEETNCSDPDAIFQDICGKCYKQISQTIRETIGWEADVPFGTETFHLISAYGVGTTPEQILANAVAINSVVVAVPGGMSREDSIDTPIGNVPLGTYSCATFIAEDFDGTTIRGLYDSKVDVDVLVI